MDSSATAAPKVIDRERIDRILNVIEHIWKMYPDLTLYEVIARAVPGDDWRSDEALEHWLREYLRTKFARSRDDT